MDPDPATIPADDVGPLAHLLFFQQGVVSRRQALRYLTGDRIDRRVRSGRWPIAHRGVYVTHTGPVTREARRWIAVLAAGGGRPALLAGRSALEALGLRWRYRDSGDGIDVLIDARRRAFAPPPGVVVHRSTSLPRGDLHAIGRPPSTTAPRSLVDAAQWARSDEEAWSVVAAGFQQRLVYTDDIDRVLRRMPRVRRRALIAEAARSAGDGAHSLPEALFVRACARAGLPTPRCQHRRSAGGRNRYVDAYFEEYRVHVEIDGGHHMDANQWWRDMKRQNEMWLPGDRVLRFPAWVIRRRPAEVIAQVRAALAAAGWPAHRDLG